MTNTLAVAQQGEAILTLIASPVTQAEFDSDWLRQFNSALMETMQQRQGVGIAAPQVYVSKRIIIVASRPFTLSGCAVYGSRDHDQSGDYQYFSYTSIG